VKTWLECQTEFLANHLAYCQGEGRYERGTHNGRAYNFIRELDGREILCVHHIKMDPAASSTYWTVVGDRPGPRRDVSRQNTWCNQAVGVFSLGMVGQDLDAFQGREYNANQLIGNLRTGLYNVGPVVWERVPHESAVAWAEQGGLCIVAADVPGGIGHVAILQPDGLTTQAGAKTGADIPIEVGFGKALAGRVEFWIGEINEDHDGD